MNCLDFLSFKNFLSVTNLKPPNVKNAYGFLYGTDNITLVPCKLPPSCDNVQKWFNENLQKKKRPTLIKPVQTNKLNIEASIPQFVSPIEKVQQNKANQSKPLPVYNIILTLAVETFAKVYVHEKRKLLMKLIRESLGNFS